MLPPRHLRFTCAAALAAALPIAAHAQHGRGYKPPPPTAPIEVTVEKAFNQKPMPNVSVIFRAERDGKLTGNLETKTDPDGRATLDLLEIGSHITVQVIAGGFATYATDFDLSKDGKQILVKLERPRAQISHYGDNSDVPATVQPGVQEHEKAAPVPSTPAVPSNTPAPVSASPLTGTPASPGQPVTNPETAAPPPQSKPADPQ